MVLTLPAEPVAAPAPIGNPKPRKAPKPKPAPKAKTKAPTLPAMFDKAAYAAHRARVVEVRARLRREAAEAPKPTRKPKTKAAPLPENVIRFPVERTRKPSRS